MAPYVVISIISYFIGSISFAVIFSKKFGGFDVRDKGSKGAGTTNVLRTVGRSAAIATLICDILKGVAAILLAMLAAVMWKDSDGILLKYLAGFFAIIRTYFSNIFWV
jgi:glycerol-3-phosphate acyltransferase PlsY